jgi:spermidine/putrescine transport system ATP-binding protein
MPDVRLESVSKVFKETIAVDELTVRIGEGEFFSLLGPSGCGKTTTLRMIGGFEEPTSGSIFLGETNVAGLPPYRRNVNTVFQSYALFPHLSVFENVAFGLRRKKVAKNEVETRVKDALRLVDLPGYEERRPAQLSGGQQQRVALARALVNNPQVLLLDEPLGALDLKLRKQMQLELKRIQAEIGITFIYVTHDQEEAMTMSDRLAVMRAGRIEQIGAPEETYETPETEFVAGFLGASNLLGARRGGDGGSVLLDDGTEVRVPAERLARVDGPMKVGVRPEKIVIETNGAVHEGWNALEGTLLVRTFVGVSHQYTIEGPAGTRLTVYEQNVGADATPAAGDRVRLLWRPEHTFAVTASETLPEKEEPSS